MVMSNSQRSWRRGVGSGEPYTGIRDSDTGTELAATRYALSTLASVFCHRFVYCAITTPQRPRSCDPFQICSGRNAKSTNNTLVPVCTGYASISGPLLELDIATKILLTIFRPYGWIDRLAEPGPEPGCFFH